MLVTVRLPTNDPHSHTTSCHTFCSPSSGMYSPMRREGWRGGGFRMWGVEQLAPHFPHLYFIIIMLPYKPIVSISKPKQERIKPIPPIDFISLLLALCEQSSNSFDRKTHVLSINDLASFSQALAQKYGRTFKSFEKQLKFMGFKSRRMVREASDHRMYEARIFKWRGKKEQLVNKELEYIDKNLKERRRAVEETRQSIRRKRECIDQQIERIIFSLMVDHNSTTASQYTRAAIDETKSLVNDSEASMRRIVDQLSNTMGNEVQLYRLLIYKEGEQYKSTAEEQQQDTEERNMEENESEKSAALSIKVEDAQQEEVS